MRGDAAPMFRQGRLDSRFRGNDGALEVVARVFVCRSRMRGDGGAPLPAFRLGARLGSAAGIVSAIPPEYLTIGTKPLKHRGPGAEKRLDPAADDLET